MSFERGQIVDAGTWRSMFGTRDIWAGECPPSWYVFRTAPQAETAAAAWLMKVGATDAWFPSEVRRRAMSRGRNQTVKYLAPVAPGYLFALVDRQPNWGAMFNGSRGKILRVVTLGGEPYPVPERQLMAMQDMPGRIREIADRARQAREIRPGDRAEITSGPLAQWTVDISRINAGIAWFISPLLGGREIAISTDALRKTQGLAV